MKYQIILIRESGSQLGRYVPITTKSIQTYRDVTEAAIGLNASCDPYVLESTAYAFGRAGDIDDAVTHLDLLITKLANATRPWEEAMVERAKMLRHALTTDFDQAVRLFDRWAEESARNLGLETTSK